MDIGLLTDSLSTMIRADPLDTAVELGVQTPRRRCPRRPGARLETIPNKRTDERAWTYVAVGTGHPDGAAFWARFVDALREAGYDDPMSIEDEDYALGQRESVARAVDTLRQAFAASGASFGAGAIEVY